jgi:hypothetical protein
LYNFAVKKKKDMFRRIFSIFAVILLILCQIQAQKNQNSKRNNIFETLSETDSITHATVKIHQDKRIETLLANKKATNQATSNGFRVQVFSSNIQQTAKNNAFNIEKQIQESFPEIPVYVNYSSPYWKVRVGDFKTRFSAQSFRNQLVDKFPTMKSEIYIVPEQIVVSEKK